MSIEISLTTIAVVQIFLVLSLWIIFFKVKSLLTSFHTDAQKISLEVCNSLKILNEFTQDDLHQLSNQTTHLIEKMSNLTSNLSEKSESVDFLFKPLNYINSGINSLSSDKQEDKKKSYPDLFNWIFKGIILIKSTKEMLNKYGK